MGVAKTVRYNGGSMIGRCLIFVLAACLPLVCQQTDAKAADIRKTIQALKASVAQFQDQIAVLEAQLASVSTTTSTGAPPAVREAHAIPANPTPIIPLQQPATRDVRSPEPPKLTETARSQCTAVTKRGTRCSRMAAAGKSTCWQH
jgi:hypothetical protein